MPDVSFCLYFSQQSKKCRNSLDFIYKDVWDFLNNLVYRYHV